jgi:AcrR family transcriptional regulator
MDISLGNLTYHFSRREDLVEALYHELVAIMDQQFAQLMEGGNRLEQIKAMNAHSMRQFFAYRFLMLDFTQIMRTYPDIKKHYSQLMRRRREEFRLIIQQLEQEGILRSEEFTGEYDRFYDRLQILGDYWLAYSETWDPLPPRQRIAHFNHLLMESFYPYMTEEGKKAFREAF